MREPEGRPRARERSAEIKMKKLPRRALTLWRVRLTAAALPFPVLIALFFSYARSPVWNRTLSALWIAGYLFMFLFYYPVKHHKLSFCVGSQGYLVRCGVFYSRVKSIPLQNIQSVSTGASPLERVMKLCSLTVWGAGSLIHVVSMEERDARELCEKIARFEKGGRRG